MIGRATLLLAALAALSLMAAPALAEHVQREQARLAEKEAEVQNGLITPRRLASRAAFTSRPILRSASGLPHGLTPPPLRPPPALPDRLIPAS
jgi:hypothetical protein